MKVGERVILVNEKLGSGRNNPIYREYKVMGTIRKINGSGLPISVLWDNEGSNAYNYEDFELYDEFGITELVNFINEALEI